MGIFDDIKRLFFVNKSVAKSAGKKVVDQTKESVEDLKDEAAAAWEKAKRTGEHVLNETSEKINTVKDDLDLDSAVERAKAFTRKIQDDLTGEKPSAQGQDRFANDPNAQNNSDSQAESSDMKRTASEWLDKAATKAEEVGSAAGEKFKDVSEKIGEKALDLSDKLSEKAKEVAERIEKKLDDISEKAERLHHEEMANDHPGTHAATRHDESETLHRSTLEDTEGFFEKAERFASGKSVNESNVSPYPEASKPRNKAYGFEDLDGDGNEIIDDAILDDEKE